MATSYIMKVSSNGQVSIPADARARWNADRGVVVDLGDRVVMRPLPDDAVGDLVGKYQRASDGEAALDLAQLGLADPTPVEPGVATRAGLLRARHNHRSRRAVSWEASARPVR